MCAGWSGGGQYPPTLRTPCTPTCLSLSLKGFTAQHFDPIFGDRWLDHWSPSCGLALQSMVPALVLKALMFALCRGHQGLKIEGVVTGFGYKVYRWEWWYMPLKCMLDSLGLQALYSYSLLKMWVANGAAITENLGRGGGCTHTQPSAEFWPIVAKS